MAEHGGKTKARIMDGATMTRAINRISFEIIERNQGIEKLTIAGIRRRGIILAERIARKLEELEGLAVPVIELDVTQYRDDVVTDKLSRKAEIAEPVSGRRVILVDDVLYTGRTVRAAIDAIMDSGRPECIQLAVMIDRGHRELPIRADYVGKNVPTSRNEIIKVNLKETDGSDGVELFEK